MGTRQTRFGLRFVLPGLALLAPCLLQQPAAPSSPSHSRSGGRRPVPRTTTTPKQKSRLQAAYGRLPLAFEANRGQADSRVRFLARGRHSVLYLTDRGAALTRRNGKHASALLSLDFPGSRPQATVRADAPLPGVVNYLHGRDPSRWHRGIPTCARVRCQDLYPGVDLVYYGSGRQLEYDFLVAPGADPGKIRLRFTGTHGARLDRDGSLVLNTPAGEVRQQKPVCYQVVSGRRVPVGGEYVLLPEKCGSVGVWGYGSGSPHNHQPATINHHTHTPTHPYPHTPTQMGFQLADYDRTKPLVIDPTLSYSTYLGGTVNDQANNIAVDAQGNAFVAGFTDSVDFPVKNGFAADIQERDGFVTKLNASGTALVYSTFLGGSDSDLILDIALTPAGEACVAGITFSTDFPVTGGAFQAAAGGNSDAFLTKLDASGSSLVYSTLLGGSSQDLATGVAVDGTGQVYIGGRTESPGFPIKSAFRAAFAGGDEGFVAKLDPSLSGSASLRYSTFLGGFNFDTVNDVAVTADGRAYAVGRTDSPNFAIVNGFDTQLSGSSDGFLACLGPTGATLEYSTFLGGSGGIDDSAGVAVDGAGAAYVTGSTSSNDFPVTSGGFATTAPGGAYLVKVDPSKTGIASLLYGTYLGGSSIDDGRAVAVDASGVATVIGDTRSPDFPVVRPISGTFHGERDVFIARLDPARSGPASLRYSTYLGGAEFDLGLGVAVTAAGTVFGCGESTSIDFPTTLLGFQRSYGGGIADAWVVKVVPTPTQAPSQLRVTLLSSSQVRLDWKDNSLNETVFDIQKAQGAGAFTSAALTAANVTTISLSGLPANTTFHFRVRALGPEVDSAFSNEVVTATNPPAAPSDLKALTGAGLVLIGWKNNSNNEAGFDLQRRQGTSGGFATIASLGPGQIAAIDSGAAPNTTFTYRVRAFNPLGESLSGGLVVTTLAAPTNLKVDAGGFARQAVVTWTDNSLNLETGFEVQRRTSASSFFSTVTVTGPNVTSFTDTGLTPDTTYVYQVLAKNANGVSPNSNRVTVTTARIPRAPDQLTAQAVSERAVQLSWQDNSLFEVGFRVERQEGSGSFAPVATVGKDVSTYLDGSVSPNTTYVYRVFAFNDGGDSPSSNEATVTTAEEPRGKLQVARTLGFGRLKLGRTRARTLVLRNLSTTESLRVQVGAVQAPFALEGTAGPFLLAPGGSKTLRIQAHPARLGRERQRWVLRCSDPKHARVEVLLSVVGF